jgi:hypothetical protein
MPYITGNQADIRVSVDGVPFGDSWRHIDGANLTADVGKTRPGGMGREVAVPGGSASRDDVTVGIGFDDVVAGWHAILEGKVNVGRVKVAYQFLGPDRVPVGPTHTVKGVLSGCSLPEFESGDGDVGDYEITVVLDELPA